MNSANATSFSVTQDTSASTDTAVSLRQHFPQIPSRDSVLADIRSHPSLSMVFDSWNEIQPAQCLDFCSGARGVRLLYDSFFKEIMDPFLHPRRLERFLSLLLHQEVKIRQILPQESPRLADERSLLAMDILVEFSDGSLANVEVQKIPYLFPGERCACYSSDLLLRQYKRLRDKAKDENRKFTYRDVKTVYTIVLFEKSVTSFHDFPRTYIHHFSQASDTGLSMNLLQKYIFISLDILHDIVQNEGIKNDLEAWLMLFSSDDPKIILQLCRRDPEFEAIYQDVYDMCRNIEGVMRMYSKELLELDRNTVDFMIDEMQRDIDRLTDTLSEKELLLAEKDNCIIEKDNCIAEKDAEIRRLSELLADNAR